MDLEKVIHGLQVQKQKLERTIAELERLQNADGGSGGVAAVTKRRGRK